MKIDTIKNGGQSQGGLDNSGGTLTGPLLLCRHPELPLEAATKQYVDQGVQNLGAGNFTTGTLPIARLPAMAGDATSEAGSNVISLVPTGVTAGEYSRLTVDAKGRATGTGILSASDLPNLPFSKIATDKPTTLAGYGITDAVNVSGSIMTGPLILAGDPVNGNQLVPKQYIDGMINSLSSAKTGDIVRKAYSATPAGFLKCNGADVSKTTYADLYAVIGETNNSYNLVGAGKPWQQQYEFNNAQSVDVNSWAAGTALPIAVHYAQVVTTRNRVYLLGGYSGSSYISNVYTAPINIDGTLGAWSTATSLPNILGFSQAVVVKNKVHLIGGATSGAAAVNIVYTASINADGTLGPWTTGTSLPGPMCAAQAIVTNSRVYSLGGYNITNHTSIVYSAPINSDGTLGTWISDTSLPGALSVSQAIVTKNRVYLCGGYDGVAYVSTVYTAPINANGTLGTWTTSTSLPAALANSQAIVTKNRAYLYGGTQNGNAGLTTVFTAPVNSDGTLGTWVAGSPLSNALCWTAGLVTKSKLYLLGGWNAAGLSTVYVASFSGGLNDYSAYYSEDQTNYMTPGSGQPWKQQYQVNNSQTGNITGWASSGNIPVPLTMVTSFVTKNRVYLVGGNSSSSTLVSTVYYAPINADGSLGGWVTSTAFPTIFSGGQAIVTKNRVYLIGYTGNGGSTNIYTAIINSDGTIGSWTISSSVFPVNIGYITVFVTKNRVYTLGAGAASVYTAPINTDGTLGSWVAAQAFPVAINMIQCIVTKNRVYAIGGYTSSPSATIYTASINSDGMIGSWVVSGSLPIGVSHSQAIVVKNMVYLLAGYSGVNNISSVYYASINPDGTLSSWNTGTSLPGVLDQSTSVVTKNRVYLFGGDTNNNAAYISTIYSAIISEGLNDYSAYYDGSILPIEPINASTVFKLPDMSKTDVNGIYHYIKF